MALPELHPFHCSSLLPTLPLARPLLALRLVLLAAPILAPAPSPRSGQPPATPPERRGYNLAPPPLGAAKTPGSPTSATAGATPADSGSGDRLEDLINQLIRPKPPKSHRRLTWKCVCSSNPSSQVYSNLDNLGLCSGNVGGH